MSEVTNKNSRKRPREDAIAENTVNRVLQLVIELSAMVKLQAETIERLEHELDAVKVRVSTLERNTIKIDGHFM